MEDREGVGKAWTERTKAYDIIGGVASCEVSLWGFMAWLCAIQDLGSGKWIDLLIKVWSGSQQDQHHLEAS